MLDIPAAAVIDKQALLGSCVRLHVHIDAARLASEVASLPAQLWGTTGGRVGVHQAADAIFLRRHAPAEGDKPIEDREALSHAPYAREIISMKIPAQPLRCLIARLPAAAVIAPHIDRAPYFAKSVRLHIPIETHDQAWMYCNGASFNMRVGEVWALNNSTVHGVWNAHPTRSRTHLICDFLPSDELIALLTRGDRQLGRSVPEVERALHLRR